MLHYCKRICCLLYKGCYITSCFHCFMLVGCGSISGNSSLFTDWYGTCTNVIFLRLGYDRKCWLEIYWPPWCAFPCTMWPIYFFIYSRKLLSNAVSRVRTHRRYIYLKRCENVQHYNSNFNLKINFLLILASDG